ncbi:hypothetical protein Tco_1146843 [Tanacetum coccineum]
MSHQWSTLEKHEWGDVFDILKRPRLLKGCGNCDENGKEVWRWVDNVPGNGDGLYRGFLFDARLDASP